MITREIKKILLTIKEIRLVERQSQFIHFYYLLIKRVDFV